MNILGTKESALGIRISTISKKSSKSSTSETMNSKVFSKRGNIYAEIRALTTFSELQGKYQDSVIDTTNRYRFLVLVYRLTCFLALKIVVWQWKYCSFGGMVIASMVTECLNNQN